MDELIKRLHDAAHDADERGFSDAVKLLHEASTALEAANARIAYLEDQRSRLIEATDALDGRNRARIAELEAQIAAAEKQEPVAQFDNPRVQVVYQILCGDDDPPMGEHWEGWVSRRIVDALFAQNHTVPANVMAALDRMCTPLDESVLKGATAGADAHSMKTIRDYVLSTDPAKAQPPAAATKKERPVAWLYTQHRPDGRKIVRADTFMNPFDPAGENCPEECYVTNEPLYAAPLPSDGWRKDAERGHWNPVYNTDPVQRACGELPAGWEIEILLENGAGCVYLIDPVGERTDIDSEDKFDWMIHEAIDAAMAKQQDQ